MSEQILKALMQLFALIADIHDDNVITAREKNIVRLFLSRHLNNELVTRYMTMFETSLTKFNSERIVKGSLKDLKRTSLNAMRILSICEQINIELRQNQKIYLLVQLTDFISMGSEITENALDFLYTVAQAFNIPENEYQNIKSFIMNSLSDCRDLSRILVVDNKIEPENDKIKHHCIPTLKGILLFLHIPSTNTYIMRYAGNDDLYLNGQNIISGQTYIFDSGSSVRGQGINSIYYSEVAGIISQERFGTRIYLDATDVTYEFRNSENGIHNLDFHEESGKLVGIIGGSGVGKSTTLAILNGTLKPDQGEVRINGYDLYDENDRKYLKGVIGFVPQDDLLIEELTVYQNLYYNARLCLSSLADDQLREVVDRTISDLDLEETRDLKVGNPLNKVISGGQRKRVNIALELLRQPTILFVDEPTSGLSSVDSETVMNLLKEQTYKGRLVIINIHQPGSDIYKMFDKIMIIDKGGYQIFYGNPTEAIVYFKTLSNHANPLEDQCVLCGNVNADQILQIVEAKIVDEHGRPTAIRKVTPKEWAQRFRIMRNIEEDSIIYERNEIPANKYSIPGYWNQSKIFFIRDFLAKISDRQYLVITILGSPLLALLLSWFLRYDEGSGYRFIENDNIPAYIFMCVITSMFFGLMVSSEEIVRDRKILKRESFLNLSWFSYINSKLMMMFLISAIQTFLFVIIGNSVLGIRDMTFSYWMVLFTISCFANALGLNISSGFNSVITVYIIIPFIIIPQLLFSGVMVKYDRLHKLSWGTQEFVPIIGDMMAARWGFEALAVRQFKDNQYSRHFFRQNAYISQNNFNSLLIDALATELWRCGKIIEVSANNEVDIYQKEILSENLKIIHYHIKELSEKAGMLPGKWIDNLNERDFKSETQQSSRVFLDSLKRRFNNNVVEGRMQKDSVELSLIALTGKDVLNNMREKYENNRLTNLALDFDNIKKTVKTSGKFVQKMNPGYMKPSSRAGRSHFFAPVKIIGSHEIETYNFNLAVIWILTLILYVALYFTLVRRFVESFGDIRKKKSEN